MNIVKLVFSPTGNTEKVADIIANELGDVRCTVDLSAPDFTADNVAISANDICVIAAPVIGGRAASAVVQRLKAIHGNGAKAVLVAVYGNREFEDALVEMQDAASEAGFVPCAAVAAIAEHSILRKFAAARPDAEDQAQLKTFAAEIRSALAKDNAELSLPGNRPYKEFKGSAAKPVGNDHCVACGLCAKNCPVGAISADSPNQTDLTKCISCMRCIWLCPNGARKVDDTILGNIDALLTKVASERKPNKLYI